MDNPIINKLAKMLRHQESAREIGSIAEAEAFATRIQELLDKHKLGMSDIQFVEQGAAEPIDEERVSADKLGVKYESKRIEWQEDLACAIARANDCETLISNHSNSAFFVGRKSDRETCITLLRYFIGLIVEMSEKAAAEAKDNERQSLKQKLGRWYSGAELRWRMCDFRRSYCAGASDAIQRRLYEQLRKREKQLKKQENTSPALIHLRNTKEAISQFLEDKFKDRKPSRAKENIDDQTGHWDAYAEGQKAGESIALTSGTLNA